MRRVIQIASWGLLLAFLPVVAHWLVAGTMSRPWRVTGTLIILLWTLVSLAVIRLEAAEQLNVYRNLILLIVIASAAMLLVNHPVSWNEWLDH
jgi:hypothetical protein